MPGLDGTGPRGLGPMTGGGRGLCVLKMAGLDKPITGIAGRSGWPIECGEAPNTELDRLRWQAEQIEIRLRFLHGRIERTKANCQESE